MSGVDKAPERCTATNKKRGDRCKNWPVKGLTVCAKHGGGSKKAKHAGQRNLEEQKLKTKAQRLGMPVPVDAKDLPQVILDQIAAAAGLVRWCQSRIDEFESDEDVWFGVTKASEEESAFGTKNIEVREARQHVLVQMLRESRRDVVQFTKLALEAKIDEQQVRISTSIGNQFERLIEVILGGLDLNADQTERVPELMSKALRIVSGGMTQ